MKANFIVGKKQIILASLVLILGVAVYLNWAFAKEDTPQFEATGIIAEEPSDDTPTAPQLVGDIANKDIILDPDSVVTDVPLDEGASPVQGDPAIDTATDTEAEKTKDDTTKHLGDTLLVSAKAIVDDNYFVKAKLVRSRSRDESIQTISTILDDQNLTEVDKQAATKKAIDITDIIEAESKIENLIKAKGFEECMVYISNEAASVVVKTPSLDQNQATQIKNIVITDGNIKGENVSITEIN